ncbi:MAG: hypothetical protein RIK87_02100 [Fuerstiella sp.]
MNDKSADNQYTWRPMYLAVSERLTSMKDRGAALLQLLKEFKEQNKRLQSGRQDVEGILLYPAVKHATAVV